MPKLRDPAFDPMIAPTSAGLHPHLLRSGEERGGEHAGYEHSGTVNRQLQARDAQLAVVKRSLGEAQAAPGAQQPTGIIDWAAQHPFLVAGALLGAAWLYKRGLEGSEFGEVRENPGPAPSMAPVIVMAPLAGGQSVQTSSPAPVAESEKKTRRRRTSQARDAKGHYLTAGTRAKAVTEGSK
ncbi:MAG: hypothetical protein QG602_412 [Verrucomicrobiota bacterium]|nr:hypothetical protein [Verrucomicrobiota bacterium]